MIMRRAVAVIIFLFRDTRGYLRVARLLRDACPLKTKCGPPRRIRRHGEERKF